MGGVGIIGMESGVGFVEVVGGVEICGIEEIINRKYL